MVLGIFCRNFNKKHFSINKSIKKYMPHITKFQAAPCHNPVSAHTINKFQACLAGPFLLPPSGMYTYSLNHVLREICHLLQNSVMLFDW